MEISNGERGDIFKDINITLPNCLSGGNIPLDKMATDSDWKTLQGGKPKIEPFLTDKDGKLLSVLVIHDYRDDLSDDEKKVITSLKFYKRWDSERGGYENFTIDGRVVSFPRALLFSFHGNPCQERSRLAGR